MAQYDVKVHAGIPGTDEYRVCCFNEIAEDRVMEIITFARERLTFGSDIRPDMYELIYVGD